MAFDATKPANNSPISSAELRSQFTSLKTLIDDCPTNSAMNAFVFQNTGGNCDGVTTLNLTVSNPPTQAQVQAIATKLDQVIVMLTRAL